MQCQCEIQRIKYVRDRRVVFVELCCLRCFSGHKSRATVWLSLSVDSDPRWSHNISSPGLSHPQQAVGRRKTCLELSSASPKCIIGTKFTFWASRSCCQVNLGLIHVDLSHSISKEIILRNYSAILAKLCIDNADLQWPYWILNKRIYCTVTVQFQTVALKLICTFHICTVQSKS